MEKSKEDFIKAELNTNYLTPLQWSGILRAMENHTKYVLDNQCKHSLLIPKIGTTSELQCEECGRVFKVESDISGIGCGMNNND